MRIKRLVLTFLLLATTMAPAANVGASTNDFYFKDFTADYYLTKDEEGVSKLHVKEVLTAVFPETNQNHGITRIIPTTNQDGQNRTVDSRSALNLTVLRNDLPESVAKIEDGSDYYMVYVGKSSEYVHGEQKYTLEYDYTNVITEFDEGGMMVSGQDVMAKAFQELYWDTNGNGWQQRFESLTANLHYDESIAKAVVSKSTSCYVGKYGISGANRCTITPTSDGFSFTTSDLKAGENLTFAVDFQPNTFHVIIKYSYIWVIIFIIAVAIALWLMISGYRRWKKYAQQKQNLHKSLFETPQYLPPKDKTIQVAEGSQAYIGKTKSSYVATLLELAVAKKITITKTSEGRKPDWSVHINANPNTFSDSQLDMLKILAGKSSVSQDEDIAVKSHTPTRTLANYAKDYREDAEKVLKKGGYFIEEKELKKARKNTPTTIIFTMLFIMVFVIVMFGDVAGGALKEAYSSLSSPRMVGVEVFAPLTLIVIIATIVVCWYFSSRVTKYAKYTEEGIKLANYLEGLELYIRMAEKDRLEFLQSVKGADTSNAGIVKLYEKLLPWASLFGLEKSWAEELSKYYEIEDIPETISPDIIYGLTAANFARRIDSSISSTTSYYSSSGGGGSSFSSGGGGGGFSGGGGGGGGGGGW